MDKISNLAWFLSKSSISWLIKLLVSDVLLSSQFNYENFYVYDVFM